MKIQKVNSESNINMPSHHRINSSAISMSKTQMLNNRINEDIARYCSTKIEQSLHLKEKRRNYLDMGVDRSIYID